MCSVFVAGGACGGARVSRVAAAVVAVGPPDGKEFTYGLRASNAARPPGTSVLTSKKPAMLSASRKNRIDLDGGCRRAGGIFTLEERLRT